VRPPRGDAMTPLNRKERRSPETRPNIRGKQSGKSDITKRNKAIGLVAGSGGNQHCFVSEVEQVETAIERSLAATRTFLCFAVHKSRFRDSLKRISTRLLNYARVNFAVLESVVAMRANQHPSRHIKAFNYFS
jgi:hypothetical protein